VKAVNTNVVQPEADYLYGSLLLQRTTVDKPELTNQALFHFLRASKGMAEPGIFYNQGRSYELLGESERALTSYKLARQLSVWSEVFLPASRKEAALLVKMGENDRAGAVLLAMLPCSMDSLTIDEIILLMQKLIAMNNVYQAAALGEVSIKRMTVSQTVSRMRILHLMASAMVDTAPEWATFALLRLEKLADQQRSINLQLEPLIDTLMSVNLQELNSQAYSLVTCKIRFLFVRFFIL
jgi:hypothetical protein